MTKDATRSALQSWGIGIAITMGILIVAILVTPNAYGDTADRHYNVAPPSFGAETTVPDDVSQRTVYADYTWSQSGTSHVLTVTQSRNGQTNEILSASPTASLSFASTVPISFVVGPGDSYWINRSNNVIAQANHYSYVDMRAIGNFSGNFTGNFSGNDSFDIMGNVTLETAFDPWIPTIILGGTAVLFAIARFFFPMVAALLSLVAQLFDPPIFGIAGAVMIIGISIILQIMVSAFQTNRE